MKEGAEEFNERYLPARYREQVRLKKQRRFLKKIGIGIAVIAVVALAALIVSGVLTGPSQNVTVPASIPPVSTGVSADQVPVATIVDSTPGINVAPTSPFIIGPDIPDQASGSLVSLGTAIASLQIDYPASAYHISGVNMTSRFAGWNLYEFRMNPVAGAAAGGMTVAYIDALTGDPYTPGQETSRITPDQAKQIASSEFTSLKPDRVHVRFVNKTSSGQGWDFILFRNNLTLGSGTLESETGELQEFTRNIPLQGRPLSTALDMSTAQVIADRYIVSQNGGPVQVNMSNGRYDLLGLPTNPVAGQYTFIYNRIVQDIPCDEEGFTIAVDAVTGEVTGYNRRWYSPEGAFTVAAEPLVLRYEATFAVMQRAAETYPVTAGSVRIVSSEIRWRDHYLPGTIPRPGSIMPAWKVLFTDDTIQAEQNPIPGVGWVDTRTGTILEFHYQH